MPQSQWVKRKGFLLQLDLPEDRAYRGESLAGVARFRSTSTRELALRRIAASIWAATNDSSEVLFEEVITDWIVLAPLEQREHPFWLAIPENAFLGPARAMLTTGGGLLQYFAPPVVNVVVAPERRIAGLVEQIAEIARHEVSGWGYAGAGDGVRARLKASPEVEDRILEIEVELYPSGKGVYGTLWVYPKNRGLLGAVQSVADGHRFRLPNTEPDTVRREFEPILLPFVNDLQGLPIPAGRRESIEHLPLPGNAERRT